MSGTEKKRGPKKTGTRQRTGWRHMTKTVNRKEDRTK
jgi:hypothetical protein